MTDDGTAEYLVRVRPPVASPLAEEAHEWLVTQLIRVQDEYAERFGDPGGEGSGRRVRLERVRDPR